MVSCAFFFQRRFQLRKRMVEKPKWLDWDVAFGKRQPMYNYIGFLDADLSTNFDDFHELVNTLQILNIK
jgi:hypothetical protein